MKSTCHVKKKGLKREVEAKNLVGNSYEILCQNYGRPKFQNKPSYTLISIYILEDNYINIYIYIYPTLNPRRKFIHHPRKTPSNHPREGKGGRNKL